MIEVYPQSFTSISVKGYVPGSAATQNPIEVTFTTPIALTAGTNYLIIEMPTATGAGNMFGNAIGLGITYNNQQITIDEVSTSGSYIST